MTREIEGKKIGWTSPVSDAVFEEFMKFENGEFSIDDVDFDSADILDTASALLGKDFHVGK